MKLSSVVENYYLNSGKVSDIVRQLGFAGIALIWLFKYDQSSIPKIPADLLWPLGLIVLGLVLDLMQYVMGTLVWGAFHRCKERAGLKPDDDVAVPSEINWPALIFFGSKVCSIVAAYFLLLKYCAFVIVPG